MADTKNIKNDELETSQKTGEGFFSSPKEETTKETKELEDAGQEIISETEEDIIDQGRNPTPFEISRIKYYDSEKEKNDAKTAVFNILKYLIPIFTSLIIGLLAFFGGVWAYKLNNIAEPIGGLKIEVQYLKENISELKNEIRNLQEKVNLRTTGQ